MELNERVAWALNYIKKRDNKNNIQLAQNLNIDKNTVQLYCHGKGTLKGSSLSILVKDYKFNGEWLMAGRGEPFSGARENFPEVCGLPGISINDQKKITEYVKSQTVVGMVMEDKVPYQPAADTLFSSDQKINIEEAMGKAYKVLNAGTALSVALYMNIQQFATALDTGVALQECKDLVKSMQEQIDALNQKVDRLSARSTTAEGQGDGSEKKAM